MDMLKTIVLEQMSSISRETEILKIFWVICFMTVNLVIFIIIKSYWEHLQSNMVWMVRKSTAFLDRKLGEKAYVCD